MNLHDLLNWNEITFATVAVVLVGLYAIGIFVAKVRTGRFVTPITTLLFFVLVHALGGYGAGFVTANRIGQTEDALGYVMNKALLIVGTGVAFTLIAYILMPNETGNGMGRWLWKAAHYIPLSQLKSRSRILIFLSIVLLISGLMGLGGIPLFNHDLGKGRYDNIFRPAYNWVGFTANRGRDFIQLPAALLIMCYFRHKGKLSDLWLGLAAIASCLMILERTPLVDIGLMLVAILLLRNKTTIFTVTGFLLCFGYLSTQLIIDSSKSTGDLASSFRVLSTALPEVRDLAFMLINEPPRYHGLTILVGVLPVPGFVSDFTTNYLIRTVTLKAVGIPLDAGHGGLRITTFGEFYINFGFIGAAVGGLLFGILCSQFERLCTVAAKADDIRFDFVVSTLWMFLFEIYLSGTGVFGMLKTLVIVLVVLLMKFPDFGFTISRRSGWRERKSLARQRTMPQEALTHGTL